MKSTTEAFDQDRTSLAQHGDDAIDLLHSRVRSGDSDAAVALATEMGSLPQVDADAEKKIDKKTIIKRRLAALGIATVVALLGLNEANNHTIQTGLENTFGDGNPQFSRELDTFTVEDPSEDLGYIASFIDGSDELIDSSDAIRAITELSANDGLKDKDGHIHLHPGDQVFYPDHVDVG